MACGPAVRPQLAVCRSRDRNQCPEDCCARSYRRLSPGEVKTHTCRRSLRLLGSLGHRMGRASFPSISISGSKNNGARNWERCQRKRATVAAGLRPQNVQGATDRYQEPRLREPRGDDTICEWCLAWHLYRLARPAWDRLCVIAIRAWETLMQASPAAGLSRPDGPSWGAGQPSGNATTPGVLLFELGSDMWLGDHKTCAVRHAPAI